jgi:hypothetical protein
MGLSSVIPAFFANGLCVIASPGILQQSPIAGHYQYVKQGNCVLNVCPTFKWDVLYIFNSALVFDYSMHMKHGSLLASCGFSLILLLTSSTRSAPGQSNDNSYENYRSHAKANLTGYVFYSHNSVTNEGGGTNIRRVNGNSCQMLYERWWIASMVWNVSPKHWDSPGALEP